MKSEKKLLKPLKKITVFCIEGDAEGVVLDFLKKHLNSNLKYEYYKLIGCNNLKDVEIKHATAVRKYKIISKDLIEFIFIFDNDLKKNSEEIKNFLTSKNCRYYFFDPNTEGLLLKIKGKYQLTNDGSDSFRSNCKAKCKQQFGYEAHRLKDKDLFKILGEDRDAIIENAKICPHYTTLLKLFLDN